MSKDAKKNFNRQYGIKWTKCLKSEKQSHVKCSLQILHLISGVSFNNEIVISSMFPNLWSHIFFLLAL